MFDVDAGRRMRRFFDRLRSEMDLETDADLWRRLDVSRDTAQAWMRGERPPSRDVGQRVAERAGLTYANLLEVYNGQEPEVDPAMVIAALEWAITQVRQGEWSPIREVRSGRAPQDKRAEVERAAARSAPLRRSHRPAG